MNTTRLSFACLIMALLAAMILRGASRHRIVPHGTPFTEYTITCPNHGYKTGAYTIDKDGMHFDTWEGELHWPNYSSDELTRCHVDIPSLVGVVIESRTVNQ